MRACVRAYARYRVLSSTRVQSQLVADSVRRAMTDFTSARQQQPQQPPQPQPQQLRVVPATAARPPYFDFNDIFGCSAGKKLSPPMTTAPTTTPGASNGSGSTTATATTATVNNNNNHSNNNNNGSSIKQQQSSAGGQQLMSAAAAGCCPVCGTALRTAHELESHFIWELERLYKQAAAAGRRHRRGTPDKLGDGHHMHGLMVCPRDGGRLSPVAGGSSRDATLHGRWEVRVSQYYYYIAQYYNFLRQ